MSFAAEFGHDIPDGSLDADPYDMTERRETPAEFSIRADFEDSRRRRPVTEPLKEDWRGRPLEWRQKDGRIIAIKDMTISHLANTKAFIERQAEAVESHYRDLEHFEDFSITEDFLAEEFLGENPAYKAICRELRKKTAARDKEWPIFAPLASRRPPIMTGLIRFVGCSRPASPVIGDLYVDPATRLHHVFLAGGWSEIYSTDEPLPRAQICRSCGAIGYLGGKCKYCRNLIGA